MLLLFYFGGRKASFTTVGQLFEENPGKSLDHLYRNINNPLFDNQILTEHPVLQELLRW